MGHKVNPINFRTGILYPWRSKWFSGRKYRTFVQEDFQIRDFLKTRLRDAGLARIDIERSADQLTVVIHSSRPGVIIGRAGKGVEDLRNEITKKLLEKRTVRVNIEEVRNADLSAAVVARSITEQIEKRVRFRKALKQTLGRVEQAGAEGVRINIGGRLDGGEMSRTEWVSSGKIPLQTIRGDIDFAESTAFTTYGTVGVKVWIYKGEKFAKSATPQEPEEKAGAVVTSLRPKERKRV